MFFDIRDSGTIVRSTEPCSELRTLPCRSYRNVDWIGGRVFGSWIRWYAIASTPIVKRNSARGTATNTHQKRRKNPFFVGTFSCFFFVDPACLGMCFARSGRAGRPVDTVIDSIGGVAMLR